MLVSTTVVSTRSFRPWMIFFSCAIATTRRCMFSITSGPNCRLNREMDLLSGTLPPPMRVNCRYTKLAQTSRSSSSKLQSRTCFNTNRRKMTSAGVPGRPRVVLFLQSRFQASWMISSNRASSRTSSTCRIHGSHKSSGRPAINPAINSSLKSNWARWVLIMRTPEAISLVAQLPLIGLADLLQNVTRAIQVRDLPAHLRNLIGMKSNLTGFGAGIIHIQDPLVMAFAAGAGCTGDSRGMKRMAFEHGTAQQVTERWELGKQFASGLFRARPMLHLYRCYTKTRDTSIHFLQELFSRSMNPATLSPLSIVRFTGCRSVTADRQIRSILHQVGPRPIQNKQLAPSILSRKVD